MCSCSLHARSKSPASFNFGIIRGECSASRPGCVTPEVINNFVRIREINCKNLRRVLSVESCKLSKLNVNNHVLTYRIYSENYPGKIILGNESGESFCCSKKWPAYWDDLLRTYWMQMRSSDVIGLVLVMINSYKILVGKPERNRPLGRPRLWWKRSIKLILKEL